MCDTGAMTTVLIAAALYLIAAALLVQRVARGLAPGSAAWALPALGAVAAHAVYHVLVWYEVGGADMHFFAALSLTALGMAALTVLVGLRGQTGALGVVVFPLAAIAAVIYLRVPHVGHEGLDWRLQLHAWSALLAYSTLAVAALLALLLWVQDRALRRREFHDWLRALPPMTALETLLFRTIGVGFVLLSATLLTGILFVHDFFAQHLLHKTVLSFLSWLVFGALLLGRWRYGWRGARASGWTLTAMALLLLAFFGSKFVLEVLLQRV